MEPLKTRIARTIKWNLFDKVASQVLYAVTGIVLARLLSQEDFGLVGAILVFQAFALMLIDSGFSSALIQRKNPDGKDYSTVFWFNIFVAAVMYVSLFFATPLIASWFDKTGRLIPLARVMFLTLPLTALSIVQANRLTKQMNVKPVAMCNNLGLAFGAVVGIWLAVGGAGAWAIVWQTLTTGVVKSVSLWGYSRWRPSLTFSLARLKSFFAVGAGVMGVSFLNTVFQNIYAFFIGNRTGLVSLGYYTQSDKWSKMGIMSLTGVLTQSFLPSLSTVQDDPDGFRRQTAKMNRLTAYLTFPALGFLAVTATPIFHILFSTKWDASIVLFQILLLRGVFYIFTQVYAHYLLALGHSRLLVRVEIVRDVIAFVAILLTLPYLRETTADDPVLGVRIFLWGQVAAAVCGWAYALFLATRKVGVGIFRFIGDAMPYLIESGVIIGLMVVLGGMIGNEVLKLVVMLGVGIAVYLGANKIAGSKIQSDIFSYIRR